MAKLGTHETLDSMSSLFGTSPLIELSDPTTRKFHMLLLAANLLCVFAFRIFTALDPSLAVVVSATEHIHTSRRGGERVRSGRERARSGMLFVTAYESVCPGFGMTEVWSLHL